MTETKELIWHNCPKVTDYPKKAGDYLVKAYDVLNCDEPYKFSEPYYTVAWCDKYFDCDGIVVAWAEIPTCIFEVR